MHHSLTAAQRDVLKGAGSVQHQTNDVLARNRRRIEVELDRIRPMLRADGLDVELVEVRERGASVRMSGASSTWCPGAPLNFHTDLEAVLRRKIARFDDLRLV